MVARDGTYKTYEGRPASQGQFEYNLWNVTPNHWSRHNDLGEIIQELKLFYTWIRKFPHWHWARIESPSHIGLLRTRTVEFGTQSVYIHKFCIYHIMIATWLYVHSCAWFRTPRGQSHHIEVLIEEWLCSVPGKQSIWNDRSIRVGCRDLA